MIKVSIQQEDITTINTYTVMTDEHHTQWGKTESFSSKIRNRQGCLLPPLLFSMVFEILARQIRQEKRNKRNPIGNENIKLSLQTI